MAPFTCIKCGSTFDRLARFVESRLFLAIVWAGLIAYAVIGGGR